jgi:hypothetical protein
MGVVVAVDATNARCSVHGGKFRVLFARQPMNLPNASGRVCSRHPDMPAIATCNACGTALCATCEFPDGHGGRLCPSCATSGAGAGPSTSAPTPATVMCATHRTMPAVHYCGVCRTPICATCDFSFPPNVHLCPKCATTPNTTLSSTRKTVLIWSFVLAVWGTLAVAVLMSGVLARTVHSKEDLNSLGIAIGFTVFVPAIVGLALSVSGLDRRLSNPPAIWAAVIWNGLIGAILLLLTILGNMRH